MCLFDHPIDRCAERWLSAAQRRRLERALTTEPPVAPVVSDQATVNRVRVVEGELSDRGAGFARWPHRAGEACHEQAQRPGETMTMRVTLDDDHPGRPIPVHFDGGSAALRSCITGFMRGAHALVFTDGTRATVEARLRLPRRG